MTVVGVRIPDEYLAPMTLYRQLRNEPAGIAPFAEGASKPSHPPSVLGTGFQGIDALAVEAEDTDSSIDWRYTVSDEEEGVLTALQKDMPVAFRPNYSALYSGERVGYVLSRDERGVIVPHQYHPHKYRGLIGRFIENLDSAATRSIEKRDDRWIVYSRDQIKLQGDNIFFFKFTGGSVKVSLAAIKSVYIRDLVSYPGFADLLIFEDKESKVSQVYAGTFERSGKPLEFAKNLLKVSFPEC
jgi:hypothetical protein